MDYPIRSDGDCPLCAEYRTGHFFFVYYDFIDDIPKYEFISVVLGQLNASPMTLGISIAIGREV